MNYKKIYNQIIDKAKNRNIDGYYENHHIIPKCVGGKNIKSNIVKLTAREHFICHWLLHNIFPENSKLANAFSMMCLVRSENQNRYIPSSRIVEYSKIISRKFKSGDYNAKYWSGKKRSDISGDNHYTKKNPEIKNQISKKLLGHTVSEETRKKISEKNKNRIPWNKNKKLPPLSEEVRKKISESNYGKKRNPMSEEQKEKISKYQKENSSSAKKIIQKDKNGNVINIFNTVKDAKEKTGVSRIFDGLKGRREYINGFKWEYYE